MGHLCIVEYTCSGESIGSLVIRKLGFRQTGINYQGPILKEIEKIVAVDPSMAAQQPLQIAILGAGIFVRNTYIPRLAEISNLFVLKAIWSRTEAKTLLSL